MDNNNQPAIIKGKKPKKTTTCKTGKRVSSGVKESEKKRTKIDDYEQTQK